MKVWKLSVAASGLVVLAAIFAPRLTSPSVTRVIQAAPVGPVGVQDAEIRVVDDPLDPQAWIALGQAYTAAGRQQDGYRAFDQAARLQPGIVDGSNRGRWLTEEERGILLDPTDDELWGDLGDAARARGEEDKALAYYRMAMRLDPDDSEWRNNLVEMGSPDDVLESLEAAAAASPNDDELLGSIAKIYASRGDKQQAAEYFLRALAIDPGDSEWRSELTAMGMGGVVTARMAEAAHSSTDDELIGDYGDALWETGQQDAACEAYRRARALDPDDDEWRRNVAYRCGELSEVISGYVVDHPEAMDGEEAVERALALLQQGQRQQAREWVEAALRLSPRDNDLQNLAASLQGRTKAGVLEELTSQHPQDDELWGDLGDAYMEASRVADARQAYHRAAQIDPDDSEWQRKTRLVDALTY